MYKTKNLPIIAIDIGGTIEDSWNSKRLWFKENGFDIGMYPKSRKDIVSCIGGDDALYEKMVLDIYSDERIINRELIDGFIESINTIVHYFKIVTLSSRDKSKLNITIEWMKKKEIYNIIDEIILIGDKKNKLEWCINNYVKYFIDDDIRHFEKLDKYYSISRIHFCQCPDEYLKSNPNIYCAMNWKAIIKIIQKNSFLL